MGRITRVVALFLGGTIPLSATAFAGGRSRAFNVQIISGGETFSDQVSLDGPELDCVAAPLRSLPPGTQSGYPERQALAQAILLWEQIIIPKLRAKQIEIDKGGFGENGVADPTWIKWAPVLKGDAPEHPGQMKCVDVANTLSGFLHQLEAAHLLPKTLTVAGADTRNAGDSDAHTGVLLQTPATPQQIRNYCSVRSNPDACFDRCRREPGACRDQIANTAWVFDRWPYDMGSAICVQSEADWMAKKDCSQNEIHWGDFGLPAACQDLPLFKVPSTPVRRGGGGGTFIRR